MFSPREEWLKPQQLERAFALPAPFYSEADTLPIERQCVFSRSWQLAAHHRQLSAVGDHVVAEVAGLPVLIVRGDDGELRAFHNVCRHRAGPIALCNGRGARSLRCRYHGWTYTLKGQLRSAPEMKDAEDFDLAQIHLPQISVASWQGLVFVSLCDEAPPFADVVAGIDQRLNNTSLLDYSFHQRISYDIACNWKVYVDNFLEGYHLPFVHPGLNRLLDYRSYLTETTRWHSLQWSPLESEQNFYGGGDALYYFIYPNTMLNILPGRLQTNCVVPLGVDRCRVDFDYYYASDKAQGQSVVELCEEDLSFSDEVQQEDISICEQVQKNLVTGSYQAGRLNPKRESGVFHFHELLREAYRQYVQNQ